MKYAIRKQLTKSTKPEEKGELVSIHPTWIKANKKLKEGQYICSYEEPKMEINQANHPFN